MNSRLMKFYTLVASTLLLLALPFRISSSAARPSFQSSGAGVTVAVPGTSDPWLAGMPNGSTASCDLQRCDVAPQQSPIEVLGLNFQPGSMLTFSATGMAGYGPTAIYQAGPDGIASMPIQHANFRGYVPENGIANLLAPTDALVGVFLGQERPDASPLPPDLAGPTATPLLKQVFLIGSSRSITVPEGATRLFLGIMDGFGWWDNSGSFTVSIKAEDCQANVSNVKMSDAHTLQVDVTGEFSQDQSSRKSLSVDMVVNGKVLPTSQFAIPAGLAGTQSHLFSFDLNANQVPRFTDNVQIPITVTQTENGNSCTNNVNGIVLLPVIVIPGILNGWGGDHTYSDLEDFLESSFILGRFDGKVVGQPYRFRGSPRPRTCASDGVEEYPTLYTLSYRTTRASFSEGANALRNCVQEVKDLTYSDKVNVVTHSKGGLVARQYVVEQTSPPVSRLIMAEPPNLGALKAAWEELLGRQFLPFQNLLPVWAWQRNRPNDAFRVPPGEDSSELEYLNSFPLPSGVTYTIIHSTSVNTQLSRTGTHAPYQFTFTTGDGTVPWFSQQGYTIRLNRNGSIDPTSVTPIPAFVGNGIIYVSIPGTHSGYLELPDVMSEVVKKLLKAN